EGGWGGEGGDENRGCRDRGRRDRRVRRRLLSRRPGAGTAPPGAGPGGEPAVGAQLGVRPPAGPRPARGPAHGGSQPHLAGAGGGGGIDGAQGGSPARGGTPERMGLLEEWLGVARQFGLDPRLLRGRDIEAVVPGIQGSGVGGMYTPSDGHAEPVKATEAFARAAAARGTRIRERCAVESLLTRGGEVSGVVTEAGAVRATRVVCAAGAWSAAPLRTARVPPP